MKMAKIIIKSGEVLDDLRSAGWLESEINPDSNRHRRHEAADICEPYNVERVWRLLGVCIAEIKMCLRSMLDLNACGCKSQNDLLRPESWELEFRCPTDRTTLELLKEKIHEYMVASVMADRMKVLMPETAKPWVESASASFSEIYGIAATSAQNHPVRRRMWPI